MAHLQHRRSENQSGEFYVDRSCIDCDTCRWMAPEIFDRINGQSAVQHQPQTEAEELRALQALLSCPTASIGTVTPNPGVKTAQASFPIPVVENIYHCGYHAENSYGAASYLIVRPEGNILVDSPRFTPPLIKQVEALGGVKLMYLTHRDDVADHQKWHDRFGCDRILHEAEISSSTQGIERPLQGFDPVAIDEDLLIIPVPGHTKGHTVLLYRNQFLLSGDHLALSRHRRHLVGFKEACWYSWSEQIKSMEGLTKYSFEWVLPGHGRRFYAPAEEMRSHLQHCIDWMKQEEASGDWS